MPSHLFRLAACALAALLLCALSARADINLDPFSGEWELGMRPATGKITSIVEHVYHPTFGAPGEPVKMPDKPQENVTCKYENGHMVAKVQVGPDGKETPLFTIKYDDQGRKTQVSSAMRLGGDPGTEPIVIKITESVTYDAAGNIASYTEERSDRPKVEIAIKTEAAADGGKKMSWQLGEPGSPRKVDVSVTFNKAGQVTAMLATMNGKPVGSSDRTIKYNEKGDLATYQEIPVETEVLDYKYDEQGNWTEMTTTIIVKQGDKETKTVRSKTVREITYAK